MRRLTRLAVMSAAVLLFGAVAAQHVLADVSTQLGGGTECGDERGATQAADDAGHLYVVWTDNCADHAYLYLQVSSDGGQTFAPAAPLLSGHSYDGATYAAEEDPSVYVDDSVSPPAVYVAFAASTNAATHTPEHIYAVRSTDAGASFAFLKDGFKLNGVSVGGGGCGAANPGECRRPVILAQGDDVYVAYAYASRSSSTRGGRIIAVSTNGGESFVESVQTVAPANSSNNRAPVAEGGAIAANGDAWFAWSDDLARDLSAGADYYVSRTPAGGLTSGSTFSGALYTSPSAVTCSAGVSPGCAAGWYAPQASLAVDGANTLYLSYQDGQSHATAGSPSVIKLAACPLSSASACTASGNWTAPGSTVRVDDKDAGSPGNCGGTVAANTASCIAAFPQVVATGNGRVTVSWADDRAGAGCSFNHGCGWSLWSRSSASGPSGFTAPATRLNDHAPVGPSSDASGFRFFDGSASGLAVDPSCTNTAVGVWSESADRTGGATNGGRLYFADPASGPASPASLSATPHAGSGSMTLDWPASTSGGVSGYVIYRGPGGNGDNLTQLTSVGAVTTYQDTGLAAGHRYTYAVAAVGGGGEGCQSVRAGGALGVDRFTLTLQTDAAAVPASVIAAAPPAPTGGYADGKVVQLKAAASVSVSSGQRYRFDHWSGAASGTSPSATVTMGADASVTAHYVQQWAVALRATGVPCNVVTFVCETDPSTAATVGQTTWSAHDLSFNGYPSYWVDDGAVLPYAFSSSVATGSPADANKRYRLSGVSGPSAATPIHGSGTVTGSYVVQRRVTFAQSGIAGATSGPVVSITDGSGTTDLTASQLPSTGFYDDGAAWTFRNPVPATAGGSYLLSGTGSGVIGAGQAGITITGTYTFQKGSQTITFPAIPDHTWGDANFAAGATASSGLAVSYTTSGTCTISSGTIHLTGAGSCTVTARQAGNANYLAAPDVVRTFAVAKAAQTITFGAIVDHAVGDPDFGVSATASSGLPVTFAGGPAGVCTVSGSTVHIVGAGACTVTASQAGGTNYLPAPDVPRTFSITAASKATTTTLALSTTKVKQGKNVKLTITVKASGATPHGDAHVLIDGATVGSGTLNASGKLVLTIAVTQPKGTHQVKAVFDGNAAFTTSTSPVKNLKVK